MQGKQAKIVSPTQELAILGYLATTRYPARDHVMFLLSMKAGLRAKEMASLTWAMVTDATEQVAEVLHVPNRAKGKTGGRTIPRTPTSKQRWSCYRPRAGTWPTRRPILFSERGGGLSPATVRLWFHRLYTSLKMDGCSPHSGRRTFITRAARRVSQVGESPGRAGARGPYQPGHDATLHRGLRRPSASLSRYSNRLDAGQTAGGEGTPRKAPRRPSITHFRPWDARVISLIHPENHASIAIATRLGETLEGDDGARQTSRDLRDDARPLAVPRRRGHEERAHRGVLGLIDGNATCAAIVRWL